MSHPSVSIPKGTGKMVTLAGLGLVVLAGIGFMPGSFPAWILPALGAVVGLFGVKDVKGFLLAGLALYAAQQSLNFLPVAGSYMSSTVAALITFVAPAMLIVAARSIYDQIRK